MRKFTKKVGEGYEQNKAGCRPSGGKTGRGGEGGREETDSSLARTSDGVCRSLEAQSEELSPCVAGVHALVLRGSVRV